jgi:hypothetical protein
MDATQRVTEDDMRPAPAAQLREQHALVSVPNR